MSNECKAKARKMGGKEKARKGGENAGKRLLLAFSPF